MKLKYLIVFFCTIVFSFSSCRKDDIPLKQKKDDEIVEENYQVSKLYITTEDQTEITSKETYLNCIVQFESDYENWNYTADGRIRGRGNSTWLWYPKKPYRIKLNTKAPILGLPADKDWVLLSNYRDPTHLMNTFAFTIGKNLRIPFPNHSRYLEVTLNDEYIGLYQLTEQIEQGSNRVAILEDEGILLSLDADDGPYLAPHETDNFWSEKYHMPVGIKNPKIITEDKLLEIKNEFALLENAINNAVYSEVESLLDIGSFIDFLILQELVYNVEVDAPRSIYIHKNKNGKWTMGPLWDFDAGFDFDWGTMYTGHNYFNSYQELVLGTSPVSHTGGYHVPSFFTDLFKNQQFVNKYKQRWLEIKDKIISEYWASTLLYADEFKIAMERENERWPIDKDNITEINRMENWIEKRVNYLSDVIYNYPAGIK